MMRKMEQESLKYFKIFNGKGIEKYSQNNGSNIYYNFTITPYNLCQEKKLLVAFVFSHPQNHKRRLLIRETWASQKGSYFDLFFIFGKSKLDEQIFYEAEQYQDILLADFVDTYSNLTHKTVSALQWVSKNCRQTQFVLKVDDDVLVNVIVFIHLLETMVQLRDTRRVLFCDLQPIVKVRREGKYAVTFADYPGPIYPPFCLGPAYVMSWDVAVQLHAAARATPYFKLEDVFLTGIIRNRAYITPRQFNTAYYNYGDKNGDVILASSVWSRYVFVTMQNINKYRITWQRITERVNASYKYHDLMKPALL